MKLFWKRTLEEQIYHLYKNNETMDILGALTFRSLSIEDCSRASKIMMDLAKTTNRHLAIRSKALCALNYFSFCEKYPGIDFPSEEVQEILEENINELIGLIKNKILTTIDTDGVRGVIDHIIDLIRSDKYKISNDLFWNFYRAIMYDLGYEERVLTNNITYFEKYICEHLNKAAELELYNK